MHVAFTTPPVPLVKTTVAICDGKGSCGNMVSNLHKSNLGNADRFKRENILNVNKYNRTSQQDRYRIPEDLIYSLFLE